MNLTCVHNNYVTQIIDKYIRYILPFIDEWKMHSTKDKDKGYNEKGMNKYTRDYRENTIVLI